MKIAILLPQKEKYNKLNAGSVSIFVNNHLASSNFRKNTRDVRRSNKVTVTTKIYFFLVVAIFKFIQAVICKLV